MGKYKILVTARSFGNSDNQAYELLAANNCEVEKLVEGSQTVMEQLEAKIEEADGIVAGLETYDEAIIKKAKHLKVISRYGVGFDKVDLEAAKEQGIVVANTPGANNDSVADMAVSLALGVARHVSLMDHGIKNNSKVRPSGIELWKKTVGIIGVGRIGKGVARRFSGFNARILLMDAYEDQAFAEEIGAEYVDFETIVKESDVISLHVPLTDGTKYMFNEGTFKQMKDRAILINTARGGIIDEKALYEALKAGEIAGAGLDAVEDESYQNLPLAELDNCILTPHAGATTYEASSRMSLMAAKNAVDVLVNHTCDYQVN